jgi:predicted branched-subunit amino acid permease
MPTLYHTILFWIYWLIAASMGCVLVAALIKEHEKGVQATVAMLLVPVILRLLLIK